MAKVYKSQKYSSILDEINKNIGIWYAYYDINIRNFRTDQEFLFLKQWTDDEDQEFVRLRKPKMTFNKIYDYYKKVISEQRNVTPNLQVRCLEGKSDQNSIDIRADIVRQIAYSSKSDIVYQTAFEKMLAGGFGAIRVVTEYESPKSFNQHILLKRIDNPDRTFFDSNAKEPTKSDGQYCGYYDSLSKSEFEKLYPDIKYPQSFPYNNEGATSFSWGDKDNITIVEYYKKEWFNFNLYQLSTGETVTEKEYQKILEQYQSLLEATAVDNIEIPITPPEIIAKRQSSNYKIKQYKAIQDKIIDENEWPSKEFPIIFCPGDVHIIDGRERTLSFTKYARDAQRLLNYIVSELAQAVKNNRREQFLATPANVSGEAVLGMWKNSSIQQGVLLANPDPITGQMPIKLPEPEIPQSLIALYKNIDADIRSILGYYEANLGSEGQELSGVALRTRQKAGNQSVGVFFDNLDRAVEQVGRVVMSLLPKIYDTERNVKGQSFDGKVRDITVNQPGINNTVYNDLTTGSYDIVIEAGPSFAVQRAEAMQVMLQMVQVGGEQTYRLLADLLAQNTDLENTPQIVKRLEKLVPPEILAEEKKLPPPPPPPPSPEQIAAQQAMQLKMKELQLKAIQIQADTNKTQQEQQIEAAKVMYELETLQLEREMAGVRATAEVRKAQLEQESKIIESMSKIIGAHSKVMSHKHTMINDILNPTS